MSPEKPSERIYVAQPSWLPVVTAVAFAAVIIGLFAWWPYSVAGGVVLIGCLIAWLRRNRADIAELPVRQHTDTAPIPLSGRE